MVAEEAQRQGVDPEFAVSIAMQESGLNAGVKKSSKGAIGVMQIMPDTAKSFGVNPNDLPENIKGGVSNIKELFTTYGSPFKVAVGYNSSTATRKKFNELYTQDPDAAIRSLPPETRKYLEGVGQNYNLDEPAPSGDEFVPSATGFAQQNAESLKNSEAPKQRDFVDNVIAAGQQHPLATGAAFGVAKGLGERAIFNPSLPSSKESLMADERLARAKAQEGIIRGRMGMNEGVSHFVDQPLESRFASQLPEAERQAAAAEEALRASGAKVQGASGASNWMRTMAGQQHQLPENILASATDMTKASPTGGQRLINEDLLNLKKIQGMGAGNYSLVGEGAGQLMLPPSVATERGATLAEQAKAAQAPLYNEVKTTTSRLATAREDAANASALAKAKERTALAQDTANRALKERPPSGTLKNIGLKVAKSPILFNALSGAGTALSAEEAWYRYKHGDTGGMVLNTLAAVFGGLSMIPPVNPWAIAGKGIGAAGGLLLAIPTMAYDYRNPRQPEKKARGGLVRNSR
jgi:hypothetical protein